MKNQIRKWYLLSGLILSIATLSQAQWKYIPAKPEMPAHPRLMLLAGEEQQIKDRIAADPVWNKVHQAIMAECDKITGLPELERRMTGRRLLGVSREGIRRIFYLSYAWRMSGENKYAQKAEKEMLAISAFTDWNPSHFLDVAEMTLAMAIGYDWLYDFLPSSTQTAVRNAIIQKGLDPSFNTKDAWFLKSNNNWNQVCNAGMTFGALAIYEDLPELSKAIIDRAVESIQMPMKEYDPDGAYPEGYGYWEYGTSFNILFLSAIDKIFKTDFGLSQASAFMKTAEYQEHMTGPSHKCYNYADCGLGGSLSPAMFWFASKQNDPSLLWNEGYYLSKDIPTKDRILPALMIWGRNAEVNKIPAPVKKIWVGQGITPVALMRTSWEDPNAIYVGFKGGTPSSNHAHIDGGSFIMEADGVRWASDFGSQDYNSLESKKVDLWNMKQNSQRWKVFRYNNFAHNTLTVDNQLHEVKGMAAIRSYSASPDMLNAISDLSALFKDQLAGCVRGIAIVNQQYVVVRDEIKTNGKEATIRWTMMTTADVKIKGKNSIELRKDGKKLRLEVSEPAKVSMKTWSTVSPNDYDAPNPGTTLIGFEVKVPANTSAALSVKLIPEKIKKTAGVPALAQWPATHQ